MREVVYSRDSLKTLRRIPATVSTLICAKITQYAVDPGSLANNISALRGEAGVHRLRVGDWRVLFSEDGMVVAIIRIAPRGRAYN